MALAALSCLLLPATGSGAMATEMSGGVIPIAGRMDVERIELMRRNWENHGTDVAIDATGHYQVTAEFLGRSKTIDEGQLAPETMAQIVSSLEQLHFFALPDEYDTPAPGDRDWWGYELTVTTADGSKSVRFHSEDLSVPPALKELVDQVSDSTAP